MHPAIQLSDEVKQALANLQPVVALETTILSHGLPYPDNLRLCEQIDQTLREQEVVPAFIGLVDGQIRVGFDSALIKLFTKQQSPIKKLNKADIGIAIADKLLGATTVAATAFCAHLAGIRIFATGGIGGVHRGVTNSFDISNDLVALSKTPIAVICSGIKSLLDVAKTLELLETLGVPVIGFDCEHLPLFYCRSQKYPLHYHTTCLNNLANKVNHHFNFELGGLLIANPVPSTHQLDEATLETIIQQALELCDAQNISGKQVTPFVLERIVKLTEGQSLEANKALALNNADLAAKLALHIRH